MYKNKKIHLIGIGGVSMSGIAYMLKEQGALVTGSDSQESNITTKLINNQIQVHIGSNTSLVDEAQIIIYTAAISSDDTELRYAKENNKEIYDRSTFLGILSKQYKTRLCISGTHGKSTTTGLISTVFLKANLNPTISIGANLPIIDSNIYIGSKDYLIMESCEYVDSFLKFFPTSAIITNIDNDHLDYFENIQSIQKSFTKFANNIEDNGFLVINNDDSNSNILKKVNKNIITYGIDNDSHYQAKNITYNKLGNPSYDVHYQNNLLGRINLSINGIHNIYNSLAVIALSKQYINDFKYIQEALKEYTGVGRRLEYIGKYKEANVYDDYAHHPTEIISTYNSVKNMQYNKSIAIFQGHTYSRTHEHMKDFAKTLSSFDEVIIAKIYPAREVNTLNVKEETLVNLIKENNTKCTFLDTEEKIIKHIEENINDNDLIITIGAGPINSVANKLCNK